jgi:hypothetical protein
VAAQVDDTFSLAGAETYRETALTYNGSHYSHLFSVGEALSGAKIPHESGQCGEFEFDLSLNGDHIALFTRTYTTLWSSD